MSLLSPPPGLNQNLELDDIEEGVSEHSSLLDTESPDEDQTRMNRVKSELLLLAARVQHVDTKVTKRDQKTSIILTLVAINFILCVATLIMVILQAKQ